VPRRILELEPAAVTHSNVAASRSTGTMAFDWDELVGGYRSGVIEWNTSRLGPAPGQRGCRAPAEVLRGDHSHHRHIRKCCRSRLLFATDSGTNVKRAREAAWYCVRD
jgi:hypothetical protein